MISKKLIFLLVLIFTLSIIIHANDFIITEKAAEGYINSEFNKGSTYAGNLSLLGNLEFNENYKARGGFSAGIAGDSADLKAFLDLGFSPFTQKYLSHLSFSLKYLYQGLFDYEAHTNSIIPMITYGIDMAGVKVGFNFRFSSYFGEPSQFETIFTYLLYYNFINNETLRFGVKWGTYDDFYAKNMMAMVLSFEADVRLDENFRVINRIEFMQSGIDGFSTNFYGFAWKGGVKYTW